MKNWQRWTVGVSSLTLAMAAGTGIAFATIPDSSGVIHGCYHPQTNGHSSALGVIDTALSNGHCPNGQTELTWNQTGPQGPQGATGATGPAGATGPQGPAGVSGLQYVQAGTDESTGTFKTATATCPTGKTVISGGGFVGSGRSWIRDSYAQNPNGGGPGNAWTVVAEKPSEDDIPWVLNVQAICANAN